MNPLLPGTASSRGLQGGFELDRIQVPPHPSANRGSRVLQGRIWGSRVLGRAVLQAQGQAEAAALDQGCQGQGGPPLPPVQRSPPPLPPWAGRAGTRTQQCDKGWQGSTWGRPSAAPLAAQGRGNASLGRCSYREGGMPNPPQPHLRARTGEHTARDLGWVAPRKIPRRMEAQVLPSRRDTLGGQGGKGLIYLYANVYR